MDTNLTMNKEDINREPEIPINNEQTMAELSLDRMARFMNRLSGKDSSGMAHAGIGYQTYVMEDPDDSPGKQNVYTLSRAFCRFTENTRLPGFAQVDIVFSGYADAELKMMWSRLERYGRSCVEEPDKTHIFYITFLDSASVIGGSYVLRANILSPVFWTLTRESPAQLANDVAVKNAVNRADTDLQGGNVIRMLVPNSLLTFEYTNDIDVEMLRLERENLDYANAYLSNTQNQWDTDKL